MNNLMLFGIMVDDRAEIAPRLQEIITRHGSEIICRLGVPSQSKEKGLITLVFEGEEPNAKRFQTELEDIPGVLVKTMSFQQ